MSFPSSKQVTGTAAILGGTGDLGMHISRIFLTEYREHFPTVRITIREPSIPKAQELAKLGAELYKTSDSFDEVLSGVDVVVNALPTSIPEEAKKQLLAAIARANPEVYFLSEFGADWRLNEFDGYEHSEWRRKRVILANTEAALQGTQTKRILLFNGNFAGWFFIPALGIDIEKNIYSPLGPGSLRIAVTAEDDIARSIARLAILSLDPTTASTVPTYVRITGQNVSYEEIRDTVARVKGVPKGEIKTYDLDEYKKNLQAKPSTFIMDYVRVLTGERKVDWTDDNANELVNPGQSLWRWKTVEDFLRNSQ
ncbi:NAD(P)-binding protein [Lentinus tigrinus ALCF2SS1-7]|uniref:NAD(P)-binding protein n=1 Tax=Lentinus tigrinus ALCF2SS1-6 TaxID=1328759 RepID=A0A5C2S8B1_9APHY|nr:NAD(P)-binding protein [Lentinus tigrinus ALCF2SS1-6]RPD78781.1 NAD(P)-binding protein [Lentinus tigrinus ALCF2SS1-7]